VALDQVDAREAVRVETLDGRQIALRDPHVVGDSVLVGRVADQGEGHRQVPLEEIRSVETYGASTSGTVQLTLVTLTLAGAGFFLWLFSGPST
jgi:hypothetical protein